LTCGKQ